MLNLFELFKREHHYSIPRQSGYSFILYPHKTVYNNQLSE